MMGSFGWKTHSFTLPLCPGSLYMSARVVVFQMYTHRSPLPAVTCHAMGEWGLQSRREGTQPGELPKAVLANGC